MASIEGHCDTQFEGLKNLLREQIDAGGEAGASIVVNVNGENVVDIWGGFSDEAQTLPWTKDTITNLWSSSKTVVALAALVQVDRGLLDLDAPVAKYWPEFAQNGKEAVLVRHILSHTSGVSAWEPPIDWDEIYDTPRAVAHLAEQAPWWEPGTASGYHALCLGHLVGELIKRTSGKSLKQFIVEEIAGPLGADFQIGALEKDWDRISPIIPQTQTDAAFANIDQTSIPFKTFALSVANPFVALTPEWRKAEVGAANGHSNARGLARILSAISLGGTVDGIKLLSQATIDQIFREQSNGIDLAIGLPIRFGIGYGIAGGASAESIKWLPSSGRICFWGGWGGSIEVMDLDRKITFTYVMNKMSLGVLGSERTDLYLRFHSRKGSLSEPCFQDPEILTTQETESEQQQRSQQRQQHGEVGDCEADSGDQIEQVEPDEDCWSKMLPELLGEIIQRVVSSEDRWPLRKNVVACACVCKRWREITIGIVKPPLQSGKITFPSSLKQPGPRDFPLQCFIKRDKKNSTFYLYLGLTTKFIDKGKFLLAARRYRHGAQSEYIISLDADDLSQGSNAYVGKLSSDFLGTNFMIYDSQPPHSGAKPSSSRAGRRFASKQISPQVPAGNFELGQVSYKFNLLKTRGPRRMLCTLQCPETGETGNDEPPKKIFSSSNPASGCITLRNKAPRWHEHLQCWCLNFHGRVTVASVKNFQLVATVDPSQPGGIGDEETVLLQFGKVGDNMFTMDYRQPLSAFQAFAICLTSFGTKIACE